MLGALRAGGFRIQRWRVRNCLRRQDLLGTALRWTTPVYHKKYSVPTPNSLWHIVGNHKLIRYRFVVHCCVDGYSRLIVYATLKDNNRADTVLELFMKDVQEFGLPSRVRSDHGLENVGVAQYMLENRGLDRGSMITEALYTTAALSALIAIFTLAYFVTLPISLVEWKTWVFWIR